MTQEDTPLVLSLNDFGQFSDADGDQLAAVKIESLPTNGQLLLNGQAVTAGTEISAADIQAGKLVFNPTHNTDADSSFQFSVSDGTDWSSAHTVAVNVKAVADTPDVSITVGTPTVISQDGQNNGWGNGDQNSPGKSSGHNAAENGVWFANGQWHLNLPGYSEHNPGDLGRNQTIDLSGGKDRLIVQDTYGGSNIHAKGGNDVIEIRGHIRGNTSLDGGNGHDILLLGQPKDHYTIHNLTNNNGLIACQIKDNQTNQVLTVNNIEGIGFGDGHVLGNGFGSESHESSDETLSYPVTVTAALNDTDGSESLSVRLTGIPENAQLKLTNADASDYVLTHTASGWLLTPVDPSATQVDAQLTLTVPSNTPQFTIKAEAIATEARDNSVAVNDAQAGVDSGQNSGNSHHSGGKGKSQDEDHQGKAGDAHGGEHGKDSDAGGEHHTGKGKHHGHDKPGSEHAGSDTESWLDHGSGLDIYHVEDRNGDGQVDLRGQSFDAQHDVLDLSEVLDLGNKDTLDQYLKDHAHVAAEDTNGDNQNDTTAVTIDKDGNGSADVTILIDTVTDGVTIQVDDNKVDFTDN